jgi:23S rRNA (cytosine1962-C5)-methyltransferase
MTKRIILRKGKEEPVLRFHPWVFSGAVKVIEGQPEDGDWVEVCSADGRYLASGHYQKEGSISVRILSWERELPDGPFWSRRLAAALQVRMVSGVSSDPDTNAFRLVFAEGDRLPGLVIDLYNGHAVVQCHTSGMSKSAPRIAEALQEVLGEQLTSVYLKDAMSRHAIPAYDPHLKGDASQSIVLERGIRFKVDWQTGQKTGFFLDQRENRTLIRQLSAGKKVLNTFSYTGGFTLAALKGGAEYVHSVDSSASAISLLNENLIMNGYDPDQNPALVKDTLVFLRESDMDYNIVILDPPAYAKHLSARHNAIQGYKRLNAEAMVKMPPASLLMTFSCSQVIDRKLFESTIMAAALDAKRQVSILSRLSQPADHPVSLFHPEGEYLKGLLLMIH